MICFAATRVFEGAEHPKLAKRKKPGISKTCWSNYVGPFPLLIHHSQRDSESQSHWEYTETLPASLRSGVTWINIFASDAAACTPAQCSVSSCWTASEGSARCSLAGVGLFPVCLNWWPAWNLRARVHTHGAFCQTFQKVYFAFLFLPAVTIHLFI